MKRTFGTRLLAMVLTLCLLLALVPVYMPVETEAVSGVSSLTCAGFISNATRRNYIDVMMKYYINSSDSLQSALNNGKSVIFMFEGGSDNYDTYPYVDSNGTVRLQAVCIVVQLNSSGNAEIVFNSENCSSIPDDANFVTAGNETSGSTTIIDGIYGFQTVDHNGNYAALNTYCTTGWYNPYSNSTGYAGYCNGINIHTRSSMYCAGASYGWCNSAGCQVIGYGANSSNEFNQFMKTVAGISFNAYDGTQRTFYSYDYSKRYIDMGYYVVDRQLGLLSPGGTQYGSGSLNELYTQADLAGITAFSTKARANASFGYTSKCTFYPSHCQIKVTLDGAPINTQPCSESTANESETIATAALGATYTATGMYKNEYDNYWYRIDLGDGEEGYIYAGECSYVKEITSDITLTDYDTPNGLVAGNIFYVTGQIASKYNYIDSAAVWVHSGFGTSGSTVTGYSDSVNGYSYSLLNSNIDYNTSFNSVGTGNHTYAVSVEYTNYYADGAQTLKSNTGTIYLCEAYFVVVSSSVNQSTCSHTYTTTTIKAATCTAGGVQVKSCSTCGLVTETTTSASGHSYGAWSTVNATCTADGYKTRTCTACKKVEKQVISATGHDYDMVENAATCCEYAIYEFTCASCGDYYELNAGDMTSQWLDYIPSDMDASLFRSKTQYRYSDYQTVTSSESSMSGYTLKSSTWVQTGTGSVNYVNSWPSGFDTTSSIYTQYNKKSSKVTSSETATDKTSVTSDSQTGYLYYHWCSSSDSNHYSYSSKSSTHNIFHAYYSTTEPGTYTCDTSDMSYKTSSSACPNGYSAWFFVTEVHTQNYTTYQKQFTYERWTDFSAWSDTAVAASTTRKVETRTVYQLKSASLGGHNWINGKCGDCGASCSHVWSNTACTICGIFCTHTWSGNKCTICGISCAHSWSNGKCATCGTACSHTWSNGKCNTCGIACGHSWSNGKCSACGLSCNHSWSNGKCTACGLSCGHTWSSGKCSTCGLTCGHSWSGGKCSTCGLSCGHSWSNGKCSICGLSCGHSWSAGTCSVCGTVCNHNYVSGYCSVCGEKEPNQNYYLFGYINGAAYGYEGDYANLGDYVFVDGKLVAQFDQSSYIAVKAGNNDDWYMTNGWLGENVTSAVLYDSDTLSNSDFLYVPGGVQITFTLTKNADGTLTLSYVTAGATVVTPSITASNISVSFEDELLMNVYFSATDADSVVDYGLLTFSEKVAAPSINQAISVTEGYVVSGNYLGVSSAGIPAKKMGDTIYFSVYAKLTDGSYAYSKCYYYSPASYAYSLLNKSSTSASMKALVVAMLNYGTAAQTYFGYNTGNPVNSKLTTAQKALVSGYSGDMIDGLVMTSSAKKGTLFANGNTGFSKRTPSVNFEGAFSINFYLTPKTDVTVAGDVKFYMWDSATYNSVSTLLPSNAVATSTCELVDGRYLGVVTGIAAKDVDKTIYVAAVYTGTDGQTYVSGVIAYSLGYYLENQAGGTYMPDFAKAAAVYAYYAKQNFYEQ